MPECDIPVVYQRMGNNPEAPAMFTAESCTSSMDLAWRLTAENRFPDWTSVLVNTQSSGRGQFMRQWHSPPGNVYGSLRIQRLGSVWDDLIPLLLAASMRGVLNNLGLASAIKWPNDVLIGGKKVGGVLVEEKSGTVVAGIGLNLISAPQPNELRNPLALEAGCLGEFGVTLAPLDMWILLVRDIRSRMTETILQGNPASFVGELTSHLAYVGERILLDAHGEANQPVIFRGLDAGGGIRVQTTEGERIFRSGSIYPVE